MLRIKSSLVGSAPSPHPVLSHLRGGTVLYLKKFHGNQFGSFGQDRNALWIHANHFSRCETKDLFLQGQELQSPNSHITMQALLLVDPPYLHSPRVFLGHFPWASVWPPDQASGSLHPVLFTQSLVGYTNILGGNRLADNHLIKGRDYKHSVQFS